MPVVTIGNETLHQRTVKGFGWKPDLPDFRDKVEAPEEIGNLAETVDLRESGLLCDSLDQSQLGSCTANSAIHDLFYLLGLEGLPTFVGSRLFVYYLERLMEGTVNEDSGASIRDSVKVLNKYGAPPETEWPYDIAKFTQRPPDSAFTDALKDVALQYIRVWRAQGQYIKWSLTRKYPVLIGFTVYQSFEDIGSDGIMPMPSPTETILGGHAVLVVGYIVINGKRYWVVKNSWGKGWAAEGYFYMPEEYLLDKGLASDFWSVRLVGQQRAA